MSSTERQVYSGRYELQRKVARGGMADVYLARDRLLDRPVARQGAVPGVRLRPLVRRAVPPEAQSAAHLNHPNVVSVYDWGEGDGTYFIVMEYVEGRSLAEILRSDGPLHPDRAADSPSTSPPPSPSPTATGSSTATSSRATCSSSPAGHVKVADFGIARAVGRPPRT